MRVVIDTNVLVSAALRNRGPERVILLVVAHPAIEWVVTDEILREYREVLCRPKFALPPGLLERWCSLLDRVTTLADIQAHVDFPRDRKDAKFLECAISAGAAFLITGDHDFVEATRLGGTTIVSVAQFEKLGLAQLA